MEYVLDIFSVLKKPGGSFYGHYVYNELSTFRTHVSVFLYTNQTLMRQSILSWHADIVECFHLKTHNPLILSELMLCYVI
jgi:capsular polysaccharide biosynthesis protein